jgi:hypothetical protein
MATAQNIIDSARYDLVDFVDGVGVGIEFDDTELLNYLNRMVGLLDAELSSLNSDLVEAEELSIDTVSSQAYVDISGLNSGLWHRIRTVWIGATRLEQVSLNYMRYTRRFRSGDARPTIWALSGTQILFPSGADAAHTDLAIYYDKKTAALTLSSNMPYADIFNEFLREMLVMCAKAKKEGLVDRADVTFQNLFRMRAHRETIARSFIPWPYNMSTRSF